MKRNTITGNKRSMIVPASALLGSGAAVEDRNVLGPNTINGVWIRGNGRGGSLAFERLFAGEAHEINTYQIYDTLTMNAGATLTVGPGVVVKFYSGGGLTIHGALSSVGTSAMPAVFTSWRDDRYGGDLNLDGYASTPVNGDWRGIYFSSSATDGVSVLDHAVVRYGGSDYSGMIYSDQTHLTIQNSVLSNSASNAIRGYYASLTLTGNEIFGNTGDGFYADGNGSQTVSGNRIYANYGNGIRVAGSVGATVTGSEIFGNQGYGLRDDSNQAITATGNWWGAESGPYHSTANAGGAGDQVSGNVDFSGFLTDGTKFSYFNAGPNVSEGTIAAPAVTRGTDTTEFGSDDRTRMLYDLEKVVLDYGSLSAAKRYKLFVTYANGDDTSAVGGNVQRLTDGDGLEIHGRLGIPGMASPAQYNYDLLPSSHDDGKLTLQFIRESGYRAVVSQVWLVERPAAETDMTAPTTAISLPTASANLSGTVYEMTGTEHGRCGERRRAGGSGDRRRFRGAVVSGHAGSERRRLELPLDAAYRRWSLHALFAGAGPCGEPGGAFRRRGGGGEQQGAVGADGSFGLRYAAGRRGEHQPFLDLVG